MLEDVAEEYLLDLINRNLVIVAKRKSHGGVKACLVHDLLRDLCIAKAKDENFMHYDAESDYSYLSNPSKFEYEYCRLCINSSSQSHFVKRRPSGVCVRCLLFFASNDDSPRPLSDIDASPRPLFDISFIFQNFQLLTILDLQDIPVDYFFLAELKNLVLLTYLALRGDIDLVPLGNLLKLQTFILVGARNVELPETLWCIRRLRHVRVKDCACAFGLQHLQLENSFRLVNIHTLSCLALCCGKHSEITLIRLAQLQKLKCISPCINWSRLSNCDGDPDVKLLTNLESLNVNSLFWICTPCIFEFPSSLKKLSLSNRYLPRSTISKIGALPNLEVLKLLDMAFEGEAWIIGEGEFLKLKYLKLNAPGIARWEVEHNSLCCLEQLVLRRCRKLEKVPSSFGDIPILQSIEVIQCSHSAAESAKEIWMEKRNMGNDEFKFHIHP